MLDSKIIGLEKLNSCSILLTIDVFKAYNQSKAQIVFEVGNDSNNL